MILNWSRKRFSRFLCSDLLFLPLFLFASFLPLTAVVVCRRVFPCVHLFTSDSLQSAHSLSFRGNFIPFGGKTAGLAFSSGIRCPLLFETVVSRRSFLFRDVAASSLSTEWRWEHTPVLTVTCYVQGSNDESDSINSSSELLNWTAEF